MKRTALYPHHLAAGARMVDFAGWEMPLQYPEGINREHLAVRTEVGLFDVSHMGEIAVAGDGAEAFLGYATLNDPSRLRVGRAQYTMLPNDRGGLVDDLYLYRDADRAYTVVCNAANREAVVAQLQALADGYACTVDDVSERWALLALQGPGAALLLGRAVDTDLTELRKNQLARTECGSVEVKLARTGYTGEDGFEIFCAPDAAGTVWETLTGLGATPCGLGARDTLRLEAGFPLYGHELGPDTNPRCTPFAWVVKDKPFYGREAMWDAPCPRRLVGLTLTQRGVARQGYRVLGRGEPAGVVTSGTISPLTREGIALAWVDADLTETGTALAVEIRGQPVPATVTDLPFYRS